MMGSGKTTVGRILARKLGRAFLDTDREIERRSGLSVGQIFAEQGEPAFRRLESELLEELATLHRPTVVACGVGVVVRPESVESLRRIGPVIWLCMSADSLEARLRFSRRQARPLLLTEHWPDVVRQLTAEREHLYRRAASITIQCDGLSPEQVASRIQRTLRSIEGRR
jgi:shikimate kinase